jgi:parallel beta-helix repeat protein
MSQATLLRCLLLLSALLLTYSKNADAAQSYDNCAGFITSIPAVISTQGTWCMKQDLATAMTTGKAVTIAANNVTIDCNDYKLGGLAAGTATTAYGIYAVDRFNATVRHCNIRGFQIGLLLDASSSSSSGGHLVEDNRFDGNTYIGIFVKGDGSLLQRNRVFDTGGGTSFVHGFGISTDYAVDILNNSVSGVTARTGGNGYAVGIDPENSPYGRIVGNSVSGLVKDGTGGGMGIYLINSSFRMAVHDNDIVGDGSTGVGIDCPTANDRVRTNTISAFATGISGCSDDGGNIVSP